MRFWQRSLRARLNTYFILFLLISSALVGALTYWQSRTALQEDVLKRLETAATLKENEINRWLVEKKQEANMLAKTPQVTAAAQALLTLEPTDPAYQAAYQDLSNFSNQLLVELPDFLQVWLLDSRGQVILATDKAQEGNFHVTDTFFVEGQKGPFTQNVYFLPAIDRTTVTIANPVSAESGETAGVMVAHLNLDRLDQIILERAGLGETGETYLVDNLNVFVSQAGVDPSAFPRGVHTAGIDQALAGQSGSGEYLNYNGVPVIGIYRWLADHDMALLAEISQNEALAPINQLGLSVVLITLVVIGFGSAAGYFTARQISRPVVAIAQTASKVALGDLSQRAPVTTVDEIGDLAQTFNQMAAQLEQLYDTLEEQVVARTRRLEMVAVLSERLNAILNLEQLFPALINQIEKNFGYYHTMVYLLDDSRQNIVLVTATGEVGQQMIAQGHTIPLNAPISLIARAVRTRQVVAVSNVRQAPDWLPHPLLPLTRSEMAVPIVLEGQVVGVLDVQEDKIAGLDEGDAALLRSLANQLAVAIRNARLFAQVETALAEARAAQARYVQQAWQSGLETQLKYDQQKSGEGLLTEAELVRLHQAAADQLQLTIVNPTEQLTGAADDRTTAFTAVVAPIKLQDQIIGTMEFHDTNLTRRQQWNEQELVLVQAIADQVAQTAENLRLFEETRQRAGRERAIREVTEKIRAAQNLDQLLEITTESLGQHLSAAYTKLQLGLNPDSLSEGNGKANPVEEL